MKKFLAIASMILLFGCMGGETTENESGDVLDAEVTEETPIIEEAKFIEISAQILCLPTNNPEATVEEIEIQAEEIINQAGITEGEFTTYQASIENNQDEKERVSIEIMREMEVYCDAEAAMSDEEAVDGEGVGEEESEEENIEDEVGEEVEEGEAMGEESVDEDGEEAMMEEGSEESGDEVVVEEEESEGGEVSEGEEEGEGEVVEEGEVSEGGEEATMEEETTIPNEATSGEEEGETTPSPSE